MNLVMKSKKYSPWRFFLITPFLLVVALSSAKAIPFCGEITGTWTTGVPEYGITTGTTFRWNYFYQSDSVDGDFYLGSNFSDCYVVRTDLPGLSENMDIWAAGFLSVTNGQVENALLRYQFDDPTLPPAVSTFGIRLNAFSGFGAGTIAFSAPTQVPDNGSTLAFFLMSSACLIMLKKYRAGRRA